MINPELDDTVTSKYLLDICTMFVQIALDLRYTIEVSSPETNQACCDYLKLVPLESDRADVAATLLGFPSAEQFL